MAGYANLEMNALTAMKLIISKAKKENSPFRQYTNTLEDLGLTHMSMIGKSLHAWTGCMKGER